MYWYHTILITFGLYNVLNQGILVLLLYSLFQEQFGISASFVIPYKFMKQLANFCKDYSWDHDRYCAQCLEHFVELWHFNNVKSSDP